MFAIISFIVGGAAGIGIAYSLLETRLSSQQESLHSEHQQAIAQLEKDYQLRLETQAEEAQPSESTQTEQSDNSRAQVAPPEPATATAADTTEVTQTLQDMRTLVAQESLIRQVTLAQRDKYQTNAQEAVRGTEAPEAPADPPVPYPEISIPASSAAANPSPPIRRLELNINKDDGEPTPVTTSEPISEPVSEPVTADVPDSKVGVAPPEPEPVPDAAPVKEIPVLQTPDPKQIIHDLGAWPQLSALPQLLGYIRDPNPEIRSSVASSLGRLAASCPLTAEIERMVSSVGQLSQDAHPQVRESAIAALGEIRSDRVFPYLQRALSDANPNVKKAASQALQKLKPSYQGRSNAGRKPRALWESR